MSRKDRLRAEVVVAGRSFLRRRTAVFFTFLFPVLLVLIFGALVGTAGSGLFTEPPTYYVPGYLAVVVLLTPLSRLSSTVARHRDGHRFEKLATTPLSPAEWLVARGLVNVALVGGAVSLVLVVAAAVTGARFALSPAIVPFVVLATAVFVGLGAVIGRLADSQDGAVAGSNAIGLPLLFFSETFVPSTQLPAWAGTVIALSPLTYFARGSRAVLTGAGGWGFDLAILGVLAAIALAVAARTIPWRT